MLPHDLRTRAIHQVSQHERDDDNVVKGSDHREELRKQIDRRDDPNHCEPHEDLRGTRNSRVAEKASKQRSEVWQEPGKLLRLYPAAAEHQGSDGNQPYSEGDPEGYEERVHPGSVDAVAPVGSWMDLSNCRSSIRGGSFVLVPGGVAHTFTNAGTSEARVLILHAPAMHAYFEELSSLWRGAFTISLVSFSIVLARSS